MNFLLSKYNQRKRNGKRIITTDHIIRKRGDLLHVCLNSPGCRYRNSGSCTMCDYGQGKRLSVEEIEAILPYIKKEAIGMQSILIGTLGSVLDPDEISLECLEKICNILAEIPIKTVIFETHYTLINNRICSWLKGHLPQKDIVVEIGLESVDTFVQDKCLNKQVDIKGLKSKISILHAHGISITANAFLGAPFLSVVEQIEDTEKTINWAIDNGIDSVVIFPANIRKNTILDLLYKEGKYFPVQHWAIYELLCRIPLYYLNRVYLAWYGDWSDIDDTGEKMNLPPASCPKCISKWINFYCEFLSEKDNIKRNKILRESKKILASECSCHELYKKSLEESVLENKKDRIERIKDWLICQLKLQ